jgi:hypothetical protein
MGKTTTKDEKASMGVDKKSKLIGNVNFISLKPDK